MRRRTRRHYRPSWRRGRRATRAVYDDPEVPPPGGPTREQLHAALRRFFPGPLPWFKLSPGISGRD